MNKYVKTIEVIAKTKEYFTKVRVNDSFIGVIKLLLLLFLLLLLLLWVF